MTDNVICVDHLIPSFLAVLAVPELVSVAGELGAVAASVDGVVVQFDVAGFLYSVGFV